MPFLRCFVHIPSLQLLIRISHCLAVHVWMLLTKLSAMFWGKLETEINSNRPIRKHERMRKQRVGNTLGSRAGGTEGSGGKHVNTLMKWVGITLAFASISRLGFGNVRLALEPQRGPRGEWLGAFCWMCHRRAIVKLQHFAFYIICASPSGLQTWA